MCNGLARERVTVNGTERANVVCAHPQCEVKLGSPHIRGQYTTVGGHESPASCHYSSEAPAYISSIEDQECEYWVKQVHTSSTKRTACMVSGSPGDITASTLSGFITEQTTGYGTVECRNTTEDQEETGSGVAHPVTVS